MFRPDNQTAPIEHAFSEPWHAQVLALADGLVQAGHITATDWANLLGAQIKAANDAGAPDTEITYYTAALAALEQAGQAVGIDAGALEQRRAEWEAAYLRTPHGQPVTL